MKDIMKKIQDLKEIENPPSTVITEIAYLEAQINYDRAHRKYREMERKLRNAEYACTIELIQVGIGYQLNQGERILDKLSPEENRLEEVSLEEKS